MCVQVLRHQRSTQRKRNETLERTPTTAATIIKQKHHHIAIYEIYHHKHTHCVRWCHLVFFVKAGTVCRVLPIVKNKHYALLLQTARKHSRLELFNYTHCVLNRDMEKKSHNQLKQIESLFNVSSDAAVSTANGQRSTISPEVTIVEQKRDVNCDVHGGRRGSSVSITSLAAATRRDSVNQNGSSTRMNGRRESSATPSSLITGRRESSVTSSALMNGRRESSVTSNGRRESSITPSVGVLGNVGGYYGTVRLRKKESTDREMTPSRDENGVNIQRRQSFAGGNRKLSNGVSAMSLTDTSR